MLLLCSCCCCCRCCWKRSSGERGNREGGDQWKKRGSTRRSRIKIVWIRLSVGTGLKMPLSHIHLTSCTLFADPFKANLCLMVRGASATMRNAVMQQDVKTLGEGIRTGGFCVMRVSPAFSLADQHASRQAGRQAGRLAVVVAAAADFSAESKCISKLLHACFLGMSLCLLCAMAEGLLTQLWYTNTLSCNA